MAETGSGVASLALDDGMHGDTAYVMVSSALVFFMALPGCALFYGGLVQAKHVVSVLMQCLGVVVVCSILWFVCGYSIAFSGPGAMVGDLNLALLGHPWERRSSMTGSIPEVAFCCFQGTFAVITPVLIIGAWVERARFLPVVLFSGLWLLLVYCPVCKWVWGGGWLQAMGIRDFAGGIVVHSTAGASAIVAARLLPKRPGFPHRLQAPHNLPMCFTGACILWVGWFGFNGGSALQASNTAAMAAATTQISAVSGALVWLLIEGGRRKPTLEAALTGLVAGLGTITPGSGYVGLSGALLVGIIGGLATYIATAVIKERGLADDSLDVFSVHGVGGIVGTLLVAPLSASAAGGVGLGDAEVPISMAQLFGAQLCGALAAVIWSGSVTYALVRGIDQAMGFCHTRKEQLIGLDEVAHGSHAYAMESGNSVRDFSGSEDEFFDDGEEDSVGTVGRLTTP